MSLGSHGVWGLDDYHCLLYVIGSAQLRGHATILPHSIHTTEVLQRHAHEYIYLEGIQFIKQVKFTAPFSETSPMLDDISNLADWHKVHNGLLRLFEGEVLGKLPVVQHLYLGELLPWIAIGEKHGAHEGSSVSATQSTGDFVATRAPWAK
jgi:hypothetical protein